MIWLNEKHEVFGKEQTLVCERSRREIVRKRTESAGLKNIFKSLNIMLNIVNVILLAK